MENRKPVLKLKDVAEILGVHPQTVRGYFAAGKIRARKTNGTKGDWITTPENLDAYLNDDYDPRAA